MDWLVYPCRTALRGVVRVPPDPVISHRAVIHAALAEGSSTLRRLSFGEDTEAALRAFEAMGVSHEIVERPPRGSFKGGTVRIHGGGLFGLKAPIDGRPLDCGNSAITAQLLAGLLCAQPFGATLVGGPSLGRRRMRAVLEPLRSRGAHCRGQRHPSEDDETTPVRIAPLLDDEALHECAHELAVGSVEVKSALLISGLFAHGTTMVSEPISSCDHTERMLASAGVPIKAMGPIVSLDPAGWSGNIAPIDFTIPGDVSAATLLVIAANVIASSQVRIVDVGCNKTRTGALDVLRAMGGGAQIVPKGERGGEPVCTLETGAAVDDAGTGLCGTQVGGELVARSLDEILPLCAAAAAARGITVVRDVADLRVAGADRIAAMMAVLHAFGVEARALDDGLEIEGRPGGVLRPAEVASNGDPLIAMSAALLALRAEGPCRIREVDCVEQAFPSFMQTMRDLGVDIREKAPG